MIDPQAISGFSTATQARIVCWQSNRFVHAPANAVGLQPLDATLTAIAGLTGAADKGIYFTGTDVAALFDLTAAGRALLDDANAAAQRTTLGLGTIATQAANNVAITGGSITDITDLAIADGGTGASTASGARTNLEITSSTWTPTLTGVANVDGTTSGTCLYVRIGAFVIAVGAINIDPTAAANTSTQVRISLPVASNMAAASDLVGVITTGGNQRSGRILADTTNDEALVTFTSEVTANTTFTFVFGYRIL